MPRLPSSVRIWLFPALGLTLCFAAWRSYSWPGLALAASMLSFWVLLQFTRLMRLLRTVADRPLAQVPDARALQPKLDKGMAMGEVLRLTGCLGRRRSPEDTQPETFEWSDDQGFALLATFKNGRLTTSAIHGTRSADLSAAAPAPTGRT